MDRRQAVENERNLGGFFCAAQDCLGFPRMGLRVRDSVTMEELGYVRVCSEHLSVGAVLRGLPRAMGRKVRVENVVLSSAEARLTFAAMAFPGIPDMLRLPWIDSFADFIAPTTVHVEVCGSGGTATFFCVAGAHLMVTAAHLIQGVDDKGRPYDHAAELGKGAGVIHLRTVRKSIPLAPDAAIVADWRHEDVAVVGLSPQTAKALVDGGVRFLGLENVLVEGKATDQVVYAGYPEANCPDVYDPPMFFYARLDVGQPVKGNQINVALGVPAGPAHVAPLGISGCSMWTVLPASIDDFDRLNGGAGGSYDAANLLKVVGVQTGYYTRDPNQKGRCVATKWDSVAASLRALGGPIAATIEQHFPGVPVATLKHR